MPTAALGIAAALLAVAACRDDNDVSLESMPVLTKARPHGFEDIDTGERPKFDIEEAKNAKTEQDAKKAAKASSKKPGFSGQELKELRSLLPELADSLVLKALAGVPHSRIATLTVCLAKPLSKATSQLVRAYRTAKWSDIDLVTQSTAAARKNQKQKQLSANAPRFRMTATIVGGSTIGCPNEKTHSKVSFRFQERQPAVPLPTLKADFARDPRPKKKALKPQVPVVGRPAPSIE